MLQNYLIFYMAKVWAKNGFSVNFILGTEHFYPADLLIVHVDLSVVPESYFDFAAQYPVILNGNIKDIRKSVISSYLVKPGDGYSGRVIVKSNLNCGGGPEQYFGTETGPWIEDSSDPLRGYRVYESIDLVPSEILHSPDWVVEQFLPEYQNGLFHIRYYSFLGDRWSCVRRSSKSPIVTGSTFTDDREIIDVSPDIEKLRRDMKYDYGKFDYVERDGRSFLVDANKTNGAPHLRVANKAYNDSLVNLAEGIKYYF